MRLEWSEQYRLGIPSIDIQHKKWIDLMNKLLALRDVQDKHYEVLDALSELSAYTEFHFSYEEKFFNEHGYAESAAHQVKHREFEKKIIKFLSQSATGSPPMVSNLLGEMRTWLIEHICQEDKKYVDFFKSKSIT